jgi:uncharacterized protein YgiM (DUF1202 family)
MLTTLLLTLLPAAPAQADTRYAEIAVEKTVIHSFYDNKSAAVLEVEKGFAVQVVAELVPWSKVRVPGGFDVWVHQDYVVFDGGLGTITQDRVRIRPLPSTSAESHALGHFSKGEIVTRLGVDGDWVHVRCSEKVAAWVLSKNLIFPTRELSQWQRIWSDLVDARTAVPLPEVVAMEAESAREIGEPGVTSAVDSAEGGAGVATPSSASTSKAAGAAESAVAAVWIPFDAAQVALAPAKSLALANVQLQQLSAAVTKSNDSWNRVKFDNLEMVYGNIIWHSTERKEIDAARTALTRMDGLRGFYLASLASMARRAESAGDVIRATALQHLRETEMQPRAIQGSGTAVEVGWVEYHPAVSANIPFRVVRGQRAVSVHSFDGHQNLRDFLNREIVVRGTWRVDPSVAEGRVLAITELRILPERQN